MNIKPRRIEEQDRTQAAGNQAIARRRGAGGGQAAAAESADGTDTVEVSLSKAINEDDSAARRARVAELKRLYEAGKLQYNGAKVAPAVSDYLEEEIGFEAVLGKR
jgi:hypothetical protein